MRENILNCKYLQDKANGIKYYVICKSQHLKFWDYGQIIGKFKKPELAAAFKRKNIFAEHLIIKHIDNIIARDGI